jgi:hypothetical protein
LSRPLLWDAGTGRAWRRSRGRPEGAPGLPGRGGRLVAGESVWLLLPANGRLSV